MTIKCQHVSQIKAVKPSANGCEECLKAGTKWVQLRLCLICGHVGCCDSSEGEHATKHFHATGHPVMRSYQSDKDWMWCYVDNDYVTT
jgi:uncharacterized UBP type Zn finger protein